MKTLVMDKNCQEGDKETLAYHYFATDRKGNVKNGTICTCGKKKYVNGKVVDNR